MTGLRYKNSTTAPWVDRVTATVGVVASWLKTLLTPLKKVTKGFKAANNSPKDVDFLVVYKLNVSAITYNIRLAANTEGS
ncbi:hypothetical protein ColTof3_14901 [Colletotrichum tofieldiae]|nr:hypothetical protein ColTof3_08512 [Colletotrichum tofieldiae]GKT67562.1 hypothetical protein ColTof3_14901 [Colletotrichum tofieldiae]